jgi:ABC-2 type transport system permease protein
MIPNQLALVRREVWEHRSLYVTPVVVGLVMVLTLLTAFVFASGYQEIVDIGIVGAQNLAGDTERRAALLAVLVGNTVPFLLAGAILTIFYSLDSLYAERKNKSILFWRSLPITDAETVISKLLTSVLAIPLIAFAVIVVTHLLILAMTGIFVGAKGGSSMFLIWKSAPLFDVWAGLLIITVLLPIWFSPFIGWLLFVSAWTKRSPLLMAFLPLMLVPTLEYWVFFDEKEFIAHADAVSLIAHIDLGKFLTSPAMWAGLVVTALFVTAAIYVRRYRDES